jgi:hypothetical protein
MCQKSNVTKRFFLLVNHSHPVQQPHIISVFKETPQVKRVFDTTKFSPFLLKSDVVLLGKSPSPTGKDFLIPVEIPRDWFFH